MKKILALMGAVLLLSVSARAVEVSAPSAVLMEKETGTVLFAKNEHEKLEPASVTKIMTLLLTMEAIDGGTLRYEDTVTASPHACSMGGSQIWLKEGERLTVDEMLKAVCVVSANDCAVALAEHLAGSEEAFVERKDMEYSYNDGDLYYFMDQETFDMVPLNKELLGDAFRFITENTVCKVLSYKGSVFGLECPNFMDLEVTETEPGLAGNTATNTLKPATVETGAEVKVPLFINIGDKITIDTRTGEYIGRTK